MMHRRDLLCTAVTASAASAFLSAAAQAENHPASAATIVDTNISLFQWPFRHLPLDDTDRLVNKLRSLGVGEAWAGSFEGLLHRDVAAVNDRLTQSCTRYSELVPIGSVNPQLTDWQHDLRRCRVDHKMPGIRLHPNYHGYTLSDPCFRELLRLATSAGLFVQIAAAMEDTRTQHPMMPVPDVDLTPLANVMKQNGSASVQILNARPRGPLLETLAGTPGISFDTSRVDGTDGITNLVRSVPAGRVMFGTHAPFLIPEAALIRTHESGLAEDEVRTVLGAAARKMRDGAKR